MTQLPTTLDLSSGRKPEQLAEITRNLTQSLAREGIAAAPTRGSPGENQKGDAVTFAQIALAMVTGGTVKVMIDCIKAEITKDRSLTVKVTRPSGQTVEINTKNMNEAVTLKVLEDSLNPPQ